MTRGKKIVALIFLAILGVFLFFRVFSDSSLDSQDVRNIDKNPAIHKVLESKDIVIGKDIPAGYYDITALNGEAELSGDLLYEDSTLHAIPLRENNKFTIRGKLEFTPSNFKKIQIEEEKIIIENSGYYRVGTEIPVGEYIVSKTEESLQVFMDIHDESETTSIESIQWDKYSKESAPVRVNLKKGYNIYVNKTYENGYKSNDGNLVLEPVYNE